MDDSSELDLEVAVRVDELASAFAAARTSDPELDPESFADAHPEVPRDALLAVLRGVGVLARARRRSEGPFERGARVGPYEIQEVIGRGGMGIVYEAVETELGRVVALKALDAIRVDERTRARFVREARAAAQLDHAAIVPVFASGETDGVLWYAMRRIQGSSLYELLTSLTADEGEGKTRAREALERAAASGSSSSSASASSLLTARVRAAVGIAAKLADALAYAHASGILHRDIKPANVLLDGSGAPLLTDFGLCKIEDDASLTAANDVVGTLRYMPPEALEGSFDARGDVYSLGLVLYELIAARPAFSSDSRQTMLHQVLRVDPPALGKVAPGVPPDLERVVSKAISKLPEERYATATDFATDLEAVLSGRAVRARPSSALYLARLFVRRNRALSAALALLALVAVAGTVAYVVLLKDANERVRDALSDAQRNEAVARIAGAEATLETDDMLRASALLDDVREEHRGWMWSHLAARVGLGAEPRALGLLDTRQAIENDDQSLLCVYGGGGLVALERNGLREIDRLEGNFLSGAFGGDGRDFYLVQWRPCALVHARIEEERIVTRTVRDLEQNELMLAALEGSDAVFVRSGLNALKVVDASTNELMWERTFPIQEYNVFDALSETEVILGLRGGEFYHLKRDVERPDQVSNHVGNASALLVRDGEVLATGGDDGSVQLHSALTGHTDAWFVLNGAVASISYDHAGTGLVAVTTWDRTVALIRPETACVERILSGFDAIPVGASFGAEPWLVSATAGAELSAHERTDHDGRVELTPALGDLLSLGSSPDGRLLAGYGDERVFYVHDLEDLSVRYTAIDTRDESSTPSFDADGSLVSLGRVVLDAETLEARHVIQLEDALVRSAFAEDGALFAVGLASDPKARDAGADVELVRCSNFGDEGEVEELRAPLGVREGTVPGLAVRGVRAYVAFATGRVDCVDTRTLEVVWSSTLDVVEILGVAVSPETGEVFVGSRDGLVRVLDGATGIELEGRSWRVSTKNAIQGLVSSMCPGPSPGHLSTCTNDGRIEIWNVADGARVGALTTTGTWLAHVAPVQGSRWLAGAGYFGRFALFGFGDVPTGVWPQPEEPTFTIHDAAALYQDVEEIRPRVLRAAERSQRFRNNPRYWKRFLEGGR